MIYEPREDSYLLQKYVKKYAKGKVLDLGSGSGIQAKTALENTKEVLAADIDKEAVEYCKKQGIKTVKSNLFSNIKGKFNLIIFNPPYLPDEDLEDNESKLCTTGGIEGHEMVEEFLKQAKSHLEKEGKILLIYSSLTKNIPAIFGNHSYKHKVLESKKFFFEKIFVTLLQSK